MSDLVHHQPSSRSRSTVMSSPAIRMSGGSGAWNSDRTASGGPVGASGSRGRPSASGAPVSRSAITVRSG